MRPPDRPAGAGVRRCGTARNGGRAAGVGHLLLVILLAGSGGPLGHAAGPLPAALDLTALPAVELAERLRSGKVSARAVSQAFLARIAAIDDAGPRLNAVVEINPEALAIADGLDRQFAADGPVGPLHGLPVLLKASIDTGDQLATHAGSLALADHHAQADAFLVARLREAGAVILGKTNLSEWANFRSSQSSSGWSSVGGQTRNPYVLDRNPCGSSSGSAVAVAANLAPLAIGTETDGSIVCPSGINGIVGIKPTVGIVSRRGIVPISHTQDSAGPMARSVADAALLLQVLVAPDDADPGSRAYPAHVPGLSTEVAIDSLDGLRIGVNRHYYGAGKLPAVEAMFEAALERLAALGATIVDDLTLDPPESVSEAELQVLLHEFKADLNDYLASHPVPKDRDTLAELIAWNDAHAEQVMPIFGQDLFEQAEATDGLDDPAYRRALAAGPERMRELLSAQFAEHDLDALATPTNAYAWKTDWLAGDRFLLGSSSLAAMSGYPSIALPAGEVGGLPVGISLVGVPFAEPKLIQIARLLEQASPPRPQPRFLPTLEADRQPDAR